MFFRRKKKQTKPQTKQERHAEIMRAKYAGLMMAYEATKDELEDKDEEAKGFRPVQPGSRVPGLVALQSACECSAVDDFIFSSE